MAIFAFKASLSGSKDADTFAEVTGDNPVTPVEVNDEEAASMPNGVVTAFRVSFEIPDNYDGNNIGLYLRISPSTSFAGNFYIEIDWRKNGGALQGASQIAVTPSPTANVQSLVLVKTFTAGQINAGDGIVVIVRARADDVLNTHTGDMRVFRALLKYGVE